jgi:hypothetical protein
MDGSIEILIGKLKAAHEQLCGEVKLVNILTAQVIIQQIIVELEFENK